VIESRAILKYLDAKYDGVKLTPTDLRQAAAMEQWISVEYSYFTPNAMTIIYQRVFHPMRGLTCDEAQVAEATAKLIPTLDTLNAHLADREYLVNGHFSLADIVYLPYIQYLKAANAFDLIESRPHLYNWWERCSNRPSWQYAISGEVLNRQAEHAK
jgi:glutathione S-transferase